MRFALFRYVASDFIIADWLSISNSFEQCLPVLVALDKNLGVSMKTWFGLFALFFSLYAPHI